MHSSIRMVLLGVAALFLLTEIYGAVRWIGESGSIAAAAEHFWGALTSDRMLQIVVADHLLVAGVVLAMLWLDAARRDWSIGSRLLLVAGFVALGSPALLVYLAQRPSRGDPEPTAGALS